MDLDHTQLEIEIQGLKQQIEALKALNDEQSEKIAKMTPETNDERVKQLEEDKESLMQLITNMRAMQMDQAVDVQPWQDQVAALDSELEGARAQIEQLTNENTVLARKCYDLHDLKEPTQDVLDFKQYQESLVQYEALMAEQQSALDEKTHAFEELKSAGQALREELSGCKAEVAFLEKAKAELSAKIAEQNKVTDKLEEENKRLKLQVQQVLQISQKQQSLQQKHREEQEEHRKEIQRLNLVQAQQREHEKLYSKMLSETFLASQKKDQTIKEAADKLKSYQFEAKQKEAELQQKISDLERTLKLAQDDLNKANADIKACQAKQAGNPASVSQVFMEKSLDLSKTETGVSRAASQLRATSRCLRGIAQ